MIELRGKYIKYDETITEDVFNSIIQVVKRLGYYSDPHDRMNNYCDFVEYLFLSFFKNSKGVSEYKIMPFSGNLEQQIKVSDILGEGWDKKSFTQTLIEEEQESIRRNLKLFLDMNPPIELKDEFWYKKLKKGDFVVSLTDYFPDSTRRKDYVFFIEEDFVKPHRQKLADRIHYIGMSSGSCSSYSVEEFRLATQQEKELYLAFGKPVHINTPLPKESCVCETCDGEGQVMKAKLYPSGHTEVWETCPDCDGSGEHTNDQHQKDNASTSQKQASNSYAGRVVHVETKKQPVLLDSFEPIKVNVYKDVNINNLI